MRKFGLLLAVSLILLTGCYGQMFKQMMDSAAENSIKLMEAKAKIEKERRTERMSVEGTISILEMREKEVPDPEHAKQTQNKTDKGIEIKWETPNKKVKYCVVKFSDGREKEFESIPTVPLESGKSYKIEYNGMNEITGVTELKR